MIQTRFKEELMARGFSDTLQSPRGTMGFSEVYTTPHDLVELLIVVVARREKLSRLAGLGTEGAADAYDDNALVLEALKVVIGELRDPDDAPAV